MATKPKFSIGLVALFSANVAAAKDYTKCAVENPDPTSNSYCLPTTDGVAPLSLQLARGAGMDTLVAVVPMKNCRTKSTSVRGAVSIAVDNSESRKESDPAGGRLTAAEFLLDEITKSAQADVSTGTITASHADFPKVGVISYGGRQGTVEPNNYESDGLNLKFTKEFCGIAEGGSTGRLRDAFPSGKGRWTETTSSGAFYSVCDFLAPVAANIVGDASSATPSMERNVEFLKYTGQTPRGSTDLTYMLEAFQHDQMLGLVTSNGKNAILITDGLPNIPKRVAADVCATKSYLNKPDLYEGTGRDGAVRYCIDRQFRAAADAANSYIEGNARFKEINVYNVLYLSSKKAFIDTDDQGELNPADFLIENSARTGNGKVKFKFAKDVESLKSYVQSLFEYFSPEAVQRVEITVNNNPTYNAVSPGAFDKLFSLKFVNLQLGANTVKVTVVYTDKKVTQNYVVTVTDGGTPMPTEYNCSQGDGTKTVDGDDPKSKTPNGDGVLPFPKSDGSQDRVPRNNDPETNLNSSDFTRESNTTVAGTSESSLRLQGGTGNCGVVAHTSSRKGWLAFVLLPLLAVLGLRRRGSLMVFLLAFASFVSSEGRAAGLNSENFVPAVGPESGLLWEGSRVIGHDQLYLGYTFDYVYRPVEWGNGKSERLSIHDHLQVNHFSAGFGLFPRVDLGIDLPISLYSAPKNPGGALQVNERTRNFFFLGDTTFRMKFAPQMLAGPSYDVAIAAGLSLPTGSSAAMMSDDSLKFSVLLPASYRVTATTEGFFTPGVSFYSSDTRVVQRTTSGGEVAVLKKSKSLLLQGGVRQWIVPKDTFGDGIVAEAGLRGDFADFVPSLNERASPMEWAVGGAWYMGKRLSLHGSYGAGIGSGVGAPMSRLVAGARYLFDMSKTEMTDETSESLSESDLDAILSQAQAEEMPPRYGEDETLLKLLYGDEILDLGSVRFEFNSARLTPEAKKTVQQLFNMLLQMKAKSVKIEGHTDSIGSFRYNLALSKRRAESVKAELVRLGYSRASISTEGFSFKYPVASNASKTGRAANRRIEVSVDGQSFKKPSISKEQLREWIYPNGAQPKRDDELEGDELN